MTMFGSSIDFLTQHAKDLSASGNRSISRITSGGDALKLAAMEKNSGTLSKVIRITVDNLSKKDSIRFFQNAISFMKFQEEAITYADKLYTEMQILAERVEQSTTSLERGLLNEQFVKLRDKANALNELTFNGKALFDELAGSVDYQIDFGTNLSRDDDSTWDNSQSWPASKNGFATFASTQDVVYNRGTLVIDVKTGIDGAQFIFGYADKDSIGSSDQPIQEYLRGSRQLHSSWNGGDTHNPSTQLVYDSSNSDMSDGQLQELDGFIFEKLKDTEYAAEDGEAKGEDGYVYKHKTGVTDISDPVENKRVVADENGFLYKQLFKENGDPDNNDDGTPKIDPNEKIADTSKPVVRFNEDGTEIKNTASYDTLEAKPEDPLYGVVEVPDGAPLAGIDPIFNSSQNADFNQFREMDDGGVKDSGINLWDSSASDDSLLSDWDRFFIEWGPDQKTSFRFIPSDASDSNHLKNLGFESGSSLWDFPLQDATFAEKYESLNDQNEGSEISFDSNRPTTRKFFGSQGDVKLYSSDPSSSIMQIRANSKSTFQMRAQYFKPPVDNLEVGSVGDFNTYMKPLGLGLLRDSTDVNREYPELTLITIGPKGEEIVNATTVIAALKLEKEGLLEQMGTLSNNLNRVMSSMDAVNKQLGIQEDLIDPAPDQVLLDELKNLTKTREMRAVNASLMNKVVQINHDMVNLLLT